MDCGVGIENKIPGKGGVETLPYDRILKNQVSR